MVKYPQIYVTTKFQDFLKQLPQVGQPKNVDQSFLIKLGFKSSYDKNFLPTVKFLGLVEDKPKGSPTEAWKQLRSDFGKTLASCLRSGYADLFSFYPDAHLRDDEVLSAYFKANSDGSAEDVVRMLNAFNAVKDLADFSESGSPEHEVAEGSSVDENASGASIVNSLASPVPGGNAASPAINVNIQLQLPPDATGEVYDKFFESMKRHLFSDS